MIARLARMAARRRDLPRFVSENGSAFGRCGGIMDGWAVGSGARVPIGVPLPYAASVWRGGQPALGVA
jgi:hypothetical protein